MQKKSSLMEMIQQFDQERTSMDDFIATFKTAVDALTKMKGANADQLAQLRAAFDTAVADLRNTSQGHLTDIKGQVSQAVEQALQKQETSLNQLRDSVARMQQGKQGNQGEPGLDADEQKIIDIVLSKIPPDVEETAVETRNKLESLQGDERLDVSAIKGIDEMEKKINAKIDMLPRGGGARSSHSTRLTDLSAQTNGSLKVFSVPEGLAGLLFSSDFPNVLMENNGFTLNKTRTQLTMTTDNAPSSGSQLVFQSVDISNTY